MANREITLSYDFIDSPAWQRFIRLAVLLVGFASAYTLGTPSDGIWWFHTAALVVLIVISGLLMLRYVFAPIDVEAGLVIHFKALPLNVDEFTVVSCALDPDLRIWLITAAAQGITKRWLVWALPSEVREVGGQRELRDVHCGFSFSLPEGRNHIEVLPMNARGLSVVR